MRGELQTALRQANHTVDFIDKTEHKIWKAFYRTTHANVLARLGKTQEAKTLFEEAEHRQTEAYFEFPYLSSQQGFLCAAFLLHTEPPSALPELAERVQATLKLAVTSNILLAIALDRLNLARIAARLDDETASARFDDAILALQKAGDRQFIPIGYIARAGFRRALGNLKGAWDDLAQVHDIAEPSGMRLYLCDALIEEAWLHHLEGKAQEAYDAYRQAKAEVNDMGYHWQDQALNELHQALA